MSIPGLRRASASPAAPTPAPKSATRSPGWIAVAAASRMASCPARWPRFGWRKRNWSPRNPSSVTSACSLIGPQFVAEPCVGEDLPRLLLVVFMHQDPARQHAERTFDHAHVLI